LTSVTDYGIIILGDRVLPSIFLWGKGDNNNESLRERARTSRI